MTTMHLGIEEMIAHRQNGFMELSVRHSWRLADFWRTCAQTHQVSHRVHAEHTTLRTHELVELSKTQLRWAMR